jgi:hypothetical protein
MKEESMSRTFGLAAAVVSAMLFLAVVGSGSAAPKKLAGTVGPGFTISLKFGGKPATTLKAGRYRFLVSDRSPIHDFHIAGPGVNKVVTSVPFTGTKSVLFALRKGVYTFVCDPHASAMHGTFRVG